MNNDIPRDITKYTSKVQMPIGRMDFIKTTETIPVRMEQNPNDRSATTDSLGCLSAMGCAQVNMGRNVSPSVRKSVEEFIHDPFSAEAKMEFCDAMMRDKGYDVWQAINITDNFFNGLKDKKTYEENDGSID